MESSEDNGTSPILSVDKDSKKLSAELSIVPFFNLALQQNAFPVVYELKLTNHTGNELNKLECLFSSEPGFIIPKTVILEVLKDGEELPLHDLNIKLDYGMLSSLSEAVKGELKLEVRRGNETLLVQKHSVEAFAADQWLGLQVLPELLCSFVTPNLEVINQLQSIVADELEKATGSSSIQGYQADKTRIYEICSAIYRAIHSWGINYSNPASSFGTPGQRIRFADSIYKYRLGTCLDTTLLFASVMEQCGLHPVILLQEGHAYIGCHLVDRYFSDIPMDDLQAIRKLANLDEFLVIETTMVTGNSTFSVAEAAARSKYLNVDKDFQCAIDVIRARYSGIKPLPLKRSTEGIEFAPADHKVEELRKEQKRLLQQEIDLSRLENRGPRSGRIARWTQKLLDLSLRNRLLNVRDTKQVISIACSDITLLEDQIAADESFSLNPLSNLLGEKDLHDLAMLRTSEVKNDIKVLLDKELGQHRLWTLLSPAEMMRRLTGLYRQSKTDLEEGGINTLFLATGFLEWKVSERDPKSYLAPILLIPVRLQRKSMVEGIQISRIDEDTVINETLLELLRSQYHLNVPGIEPLPTDESGVDVGLVIQIFRQTTKDMKGWEVREEARIGHFSFGKFVMWNDMTSQIDSLKQNPLVSHLIEGGGLFDDGIEVFPPSEVSQYTDLKNLYCPMSADSSQLTAVLYSQMGKNVVLHGPPGTGKSQTITNIIAHNLALGRRILFVSEKKAALEVVHRRLTSIGLRPFCLELHSNKSGKAEVLAQFSEALKVPENGISGEWNATTDALQKVRDELNEYVSALHYVYPNGLSAYHCFSKLAGEDRNVPDGLLKIDFLKQTRETFDTVKQLASDLAHAWTGTNPDAISALSWLDAVDWSPVFEKEMLSAAKALLVSSTELAGHFGEQTEWLGLGSTCSIDHIYNTAVLAEALKETENIPAAFLSDDFPALVEFLTKFQNTAIRNAELREKLKSYQLDLLAELDIGGIESRIQNNRKLFCLIRFFRNRALLRELSGVKKLGGGKLTLDELTMLLPDAQEYAAVTHEYQGNAEKASASLGKLWNEGTPDWNTLKNVSEQTQKILAMVGKAAENDSMRKQCLAKLQTFLPDSMNFFAKGAASREKINAFLLAWNHFQEHQQTFAGYARGILLENNLKKLIAKVKESIDRINDLRGVMRYRKMRSAAEQQGMKETADAIESERLPAKEMPQIFDFIYCREMLDQILAGSPILCNFTGLNQEERIRKFCELDAKYTGLSKQIIFAKLASTLPRRRSGPCPEGTELGILKRECEKRTRQKPVRQLLEQIPTLVSVLKPCFLMSPLSVAQYLPPDSAPFDLIVFDEASQIPVWDAIGVIARGKQLIVVGDPKQMPPTAFFQKGEAGEETESLPDEIEDADSILNECLAAGVHPSYLNWHYRSRHESLISFSNHYYYEDKLFTFPAARNSDRLGVRFEFVPNGIYDRKATRTNQREAKALVDYVFARLENPNLKKRSIGIVTFSQAQKDLIEDLVEQKRMKYPQLESFFSDQNEEPFFVKNLENVQGDERDVILFSICYARDAEGKFSMNFGPLNCKGGERRLNVAITRAKEQVIVFSSIHATQIELSRTNATGALHLKYFLDYAEKGFHIQSRANAETLGDGLGKTIAGFLMQQGFSIERNVGNSGFRIDIAVRHPKNPAEFLLGIECDGVSYASQKTTRDRDHLRGSVLHSLGWHTYHAWSVDWAFDRKRAEASLLETIKKLEQASEEPSPLSVQPHVPEMETPPVTEPNAPPLSAMASKHRQKYSIWEKDCTEPQESFYEIGTRDLIRNLMHEVVQKEAPVYEKLMMKRIIKAWGFNRTGETIQNVLNACIPNDLKTTKTGENRVFWSCDQSPSTYADYRVPTDENSKRAIDEIPPEELANAMYEVLMDFNSCERDTLYRETVKLFGLSTVTSKARKCLDVGMLVLKQSGKV